MKLYALMFTTLIILTACGGYDEFLDPSSEVAEQKSMCESGESCESDAPLALPASYTLTLKLWNATLMWRKCSLVYSYTNLAGAYVSGTVVSSELVEPQGWRTGEVQIPWVTMGPVTMTGGCWHPSDGMVDRCINSLTKSIDSSTTIEFYYSFLNGQPRVEIIQ